MRRLTQQHEKFCRAYHAKLSAAQAAIAAGYARGNSYNTGSRLLQRPDIRQRLDELSAEQAERDRKAERDLQRTRTMIGKLDEAYSGAVRQGNWLAIVRIVEMQAKLAGLIGPRRTLPTIMDESEIGFDWMEGAEDEEAEQIEENEAVEAACGNPPLCDPPQSDPHLSDPPALEESLAEPSSDAPPPPVEPAVMPVVGLDDAAADAPASAPPEAARDGASAEDVEKCAAQRQKVYRMALDAATRSRMRRLHDAGR